MLMAARRRVARFREPRASARLAVGLWILWAFLAWNVVFDHVIVLAGRDYIAAAERAFAHGSYARMDDWMRPAVGRAFWIATVSGATILATGLLLVRVASRTVRIER